MGKAEKGTPKDIAKKIKSKGLQKLKFWCQVCEKQCRDANGFKCHLTSDSHLRQIKLFSENARQELDHYSRDFEQMFLETLRMRHGSQTFVNANNVYQEVIQDKHHVHMNATMWATLTDFVKYLGKQGKCAVKEDERGWYVQFIQRDLEVLQRNEVLHKRQQAELQAEAQWHERIQKQRLHAAIAFAEKQQYTTATEEGGSAASAIQPPEATAIHSQQNQQLTTISLTIATKKKPEQKKKKFSSVFADTDDEDDDNDEDVVPPSAPEPPTLPSRQQEQEPQQKLPPQSQQSTSAALTTTTPSSCWLHEGIVVRIVEKHSPYFKEKAIVEQILFGEEKETEKSSSSSSSTTRIKYPAARVSLLHNDNHQEQQQNSIIVSMKHLETVVPKSVGETVMIVSDSVGRGRGRHSSSSSYKGRRATVVELDKKMCRAVLKLLQDHGHNQEDNDVLLKKVDFDHFSKLASK